MVKSKSPIKQPPSGVTGISKLFQASRLDYCPDASPPRQPKDATAMDVNPLPSQVISLAMDVNPPPSKAISSAMEIDFPPGCLPPPPAATLPTKTHGQLKVPT